MTFSWIHKFVKFFLSTASVLSYVVFLPIAVGLCCEHQSSVLYFCTTFLRYHQQGSEKYNSASSSQWSWPLDSLFLTKAWDRMQSVDVTFVYQTVPYLLYPWACAEQLLQNKLANIACSTCRRLWVIKWVSVLLQISSVVLIVHAYLLILKLGLSHWLENLADCPYFTSSLVGNQGHWEDFDEHCEICFALKSHSIWLPLLCAGVWLVCTFECFEITELD